MTVSTIKVAAGEHVAGCPFCNAPRDLVQLHDDGEGVYATCLHCAADGPFVPHVPATGTAPARAARLKWNMRWPTPLAAVDRIGDGAERARRDAEHSDMVVLVRALVAQLEQLLRPAALPPRKVAGAWWPRDAVTAEQAAREWLAARGLA